MIIFTNRALCP